jgi:acyl carrier protein
MSRATRIEEVFRESLNLTPDYPAAEIIYNETPGWDSLMHLNIVAALEEAFGIMLDTDDVLDMSSFAKAREIIAKYVPND